LLLLEMALQGPTANGCTNQAHWSHSPHQRGRTNSEDGSAWAADAAHVLRHLPPGYCSDNLAQHRQSPFRKKRLWRAMVPAGGR
jgi:hypothetical protein